MGLLCDAFVIFIIFIYVKKNYRRKQLRVCLETVSFVGAVAVALPFSNLLSNFFWNWFFRDSFAERIIKPVNSTPFIFSTQSNLERILDKMPSIIRFAHDDYGVSSQHNIERINGLLQGDLSASPVAITNIVAGPVVEGIFRAVLCLVLFSGALYLFKAMFAVAENTIGEPDRIFHNEYLGALMGIFKALIMLSIMFAAAKLLIPAFPINLPVFSDKFMDNSLLYRLLVLDNPIFLFLSKGIYPVVV